MCGAFLPILNQTTARNGVAMAVRPDTTTKSSAPIPANAEEDLEQYGVWVKAEPQDIIEEPEVVSLEDSDFGIPSAEPLSPEDNLLSSDEDKLIGSFERLDSSASSSAASLDSGMESLPPLEDFEIPDTEAGVEELGAATIDISLDDLEPQSPISPNADIDLSTVRGLEDGASSIEFSPIEPVEEGKAMPGEIEDVSAEFLDIMEPSSGTAERDVTAEFLGEGAVSEPASEPEPEFEPIDMELHFDETLNGGEGFTESSSEPGFETVSEFDDFLHEEKTSPEAASGRMPPAFDDLEAVERELSEPAPSPAGAGRSARPEASPSLANDLLERIASELSSIRGELVTLKSQIGSLKGEEAAAPQAEAEEPKARTAAGGFFDEEEDETIALTGDELDNILNTADFTEESPGEEGPAIDVDLGSVSLEEESILPESGDYQSAEALPGIEEIHLEPAEAAIEEPPANDFPEIEIMAEEGVNPLTQAPEDTSYLDLEAGEEIDLSEIPLHEEALGAMPGIPEEAELIEETEEVTAVQEEELPEIEAFEDLTLGMEAKPGYMPEPVEEAKPVESLPEIEDIDFGEISLAEESSASVEEVEEVEEAEEVEELDVMEDDLSPAATSSIEDSELAARLEASTIKPAEPVSFHPDEIPMDLDDSFFVGAPEAARPEELEPIEAAEPAPAPARKAEAPKATQQPPMGDNDRLKNEIRGVLSYLDKLLESLPESKIDEFAHSEYFDTYKKLFEELGLV